MRGMLESLWRYRGFVRASVARDFQLRYRGSALGIGWTLLQPIGTVVVLTLVFTGIMRPRVPDAGPFAYSIYLCAGVFSWGLFAEIVQRELNVFIEHANFLKKSSFPRSTLPLIVALSALVNFALAFAIYLLFLVVVGRFPGWIAFASIPIVLLIALFGVGLGVLLGTANVFFRDLASAVPVVMQFWFWLTPIVYPVSAVPDFLRPWLALHPMTPLAMGLQRIFAENAMPNWPSLVAPMLVSVAACVVGMTAFRAHSDNLVDEL